MADYQFAGRAAGVEFLMDAFAFESGGSR